MRIRTLVVLVVLLIPAALSAQVGARRGPGRRVPTQPAGLPPQLPPQPAPIANALAYKRMRISVEGYQFVSYFQAPGISGVGSVPNWTSLGSGTRAEYRLSPFVGATLDLTSSYLGGPANTRSAELGTRFHPERTEHRAYPFFDLRMAYVTAYNSDPVAFVDDGFATAPAYNSSNARYTRGFGGVAGSGMEYTLTRRFSLLTGAAVARSRMSTRSLIAGSEPIADYTMTSYRVMLGLRFNPVRMMTPISVQRR